MKKITLAFLFAVALGSILVAAAELKQAPAPAPAVAVLAPQPPAPGDRKAFNAAIERGEATVVYVGDSITAGSDVKYGKSWTELLSADLAKAYPKVKFKFVNMAIPGRGVQHALMDNYLAMPKDGPATEGYFMPKGIGDFWPEGSTPGKSWNQAVLDEKPDLIIAAFGMNDISGDEESYFKVLMWLVGTYRLGESHPSIALVATPLPSRTAKLYAGLQDNIDATATATRRAAIYTNSTLIDANQVYKGLRDHESDNNFAFYGGSESALLGGGIVGWFIGGNGINHPSTIGHRLIYPPAYQGLLSK